MEAWPKMSYIEQLYCIYSDTYKDAYGIRPRGVVGSCYTEAELEAEIARLSEVVERNIEMEREEEHVAAERFEKRVIETIMAGAPNRETACRRIYEADAAYDWDHLCFINGLAYGYFRDMK